MPELTDQLSNMVPARSSFLPSDATLEDSSIHLTQLFCDLVPNDITSSTFADPSSLLTPSTNTVSTYKDRNAKVRGKCCGICQRVFSRKYELKDHMSSVHMGKKSEFEHIFSLCLMSNCLSFVGHCCSDCNERFGTQSNLTRHRKSARCIRSRASLSA